MYDCIFKNQYPAQIFAYRLRSISQGKVKKKHIHLQVKISLELRCRVLVFSGLIETTLPIGNYKDVEQFSSCC